MKSPLVGGAAASQQDKSPAPGSGLSKKGHKKKNATKRAQNAPVLWRPTTGRIAA
jgi:hypothetical protein